MALRNRYKKKNGSSLADILQASVPDNALSAMKTNSAFVHGGRYELADGRTDQYWVVGRWI